MVLKSLKNNRHIWILQADKGNCTVVLNESTYNEKIASLLDAGVYEILRKDPTAQIDQLDPITIYIYIYIYITLYATIFAFITHQFM
jgi:hypothetical protein